MSSLLYKKCNALLETLNNMTDPNGTLLVRADLVERITKVWNEIVAAMNQPSHRGEHVDKVFQVLEGKMKGLVQLHVFSLPTADLHYFQVDIFSNLQVLRLDMCPPSTIKGIYSMRNALQSLVVTNSGITTLSKSLAPFKKKILHQLSPMIFPGEVFTIPPQYLWSNLTTLKLSNCGITKIDESLHFFPSIEYLDLSHNTITHVIHLQDCIDLKFLNLSHNRIRVLSNLERVIGSVTMLSLAYNDIESLDGIERILSLEKLDVANNHINDYAEIDHLCRMPNLEAVRLAGNPLAISQTTHGHYRMRVFRSFIQDGRVMKGTRPFPVLDGEPMSLKEKQFFKRVMFRSTTDKEATFSHFDANLLSSTDVMLDQELGGEWGSMVDFSGDADEAEFGDIYARGDSKDTDFSFNDEITGVKRPPTTGSGGVGELGSPQVALKGTFASLSPMVGSNHNNSRSASVASPTVPTHARNSRMSMDSTSTGRLSPMGGSSLNLTGRTSSVAHRTLSTAFGGARLSFYGGRTASNAGDVSRASFLSTGAPMNGPLGISSPSKRLALRYIQASKAESGEASGSTNQTATADAASVPKMRVKRLALIGAPNSKEVYPDLVEVEQTMAALREKLRAEAQALAAARQLEEASRQSIGIASSFASSHDSPLNSYSNVNGIRDSFDNKLVDNKFAALSLHQPSASTQDDSRASSYNESVPTSAMDDLRRRVGVDHAASSLDERETSTLLMRGFSEKNKQLLSSETSSRNYTPMSTADEKHRGFSFGNESEVQAGSYVSGGNSVPPSPYAPEVNPLLDRSAKRATMFVPPMHPVHNRPAHRRSITDASDFGEEDSEDLTGMESVRNSITTRPSEITRNVSAGRPAYANVPASARASEAVLRRTNTQDTAVTSITTAEPDTEETPLGSNVYVGDPDYRNLSVVENMDLYMKEQVFNVKRPSGISPYMKDANSVASGLAMDGDGEDTSSQFIQTAYRYEKFITVFCEKIIDISGSIPVTADGRTVSGGAPPAASSRALKSRRDQLPRAEEEAAAAREETRYLVLTDACLYIVVVDFPANAMFGDAPVPMVERAHKLYTLCNCMIFFGFQRCILSFADEEQYKDLIYDALAQQAENTTGNSVTAAQKEEQVLSGEVVRYQYMILTREKTRTYPLITRVNKAANAQRSAHVPIPLSNVQIDNKDFQLVEKVMHLTLSLGGDHDIVHYQMAYQIWRKRPGVKVPRTIVLTQTLLILCVEELDKPDIHLEVIDTTSLGNVLKISMDNNPLYITFELKSSNALFAKTRKWRMCTDSRATSTRLQEECRRACAEQGNKV